MALTITITLPSTAFAQGLFDLLFGNSRPPPSAAPALSGPPGTSITVHPRQGYGEGHATSYGPSRAYCVRICDGRFFPVPTAGSGSVIEACKGLCPAAEMTVYYGSTIEEAQTMRGQRYARLANAFRYRQEIVDGCSCTGGTALGTARMTIENDPTLRAGDIVADFSGMMVVTETRSHRRGPRFRPLSHAQLRQYKLPLASVHGGRGLMPESTTPPIVAATR